MCYGSLLVATARNRLTHMSRSAISAPETQRTYKVVMATAQQEDPELMAMGQVLSALTPLDPESQRRVMDWVVVRLGLKMTFGDKKGSPASTEEPDVPNQSKSPLGKDVHINTVVNKLGVNSCRTLLQAATYYLVAIKGAERFTREELVACARTARAWREDYATQISVNIIRMCESKELIQRADNVYDIDPKLQTALEQKLNA